MNITLALLILATVAAGIGAAKLYLIYVRVDLDRLVRLEFWSDEFVKSCGPLLDDPDTPDVIISDLRVLNLVINLPEAPTVLLRILRRIEKSRKSGHRQQYSSTERQFLRRRPELEESVAQTFFAAFMVISYQSRLLGWLLRARMTELFSPKDKASNAACAVREIGVNLPNDALAV